MRIIVILIAALLGLWIAPVSASNMPEVRTLAEAAQSPQASIDEIAWLAGRWKGEGLGGKAEELIAPVEAGQMMGMFRHLKADGTLNFYEFYVFAEVEGSLVLKIKHFSPELIGWEEKDGYVEFPLVAIEGATAYFDGITYALTAEDELNVMVNVSEAGIIPFRYRRQTDD